MTQRNHTRKSDYRQRGYRSLHIKESTHNRLTMAKLHRQMVEGRFLNQDEFVSHLLDHYETTIAQPEAVVTEPA